MINACWWVGDSMTPLCGMKAVAFCDKLELTKKQNLLQFLPTDAWKENLTNLRRCLYLAPNWYNHWQWNPGHTWWDIRVHRLEFAPPHRKTQSKKQCLHKSCLRVFIRGCTPLFISNFVFTYILVVVITLQKLVQILRKSMIAR